MRYLAALAVVLLACADDTKRPRDKGGLGGEGGENAEHVDDLASLVLEIRGLPDELEPPVSLYSPQGAKYVLYRSTTFQVLRPGVYRITVPGMLQHGDDLYVTEFRASEIALAPGDEKVVTILFERLPYRILTDDDFVLPWRGSGELHVRVERDAGFRDPLHLRVEQMHPSFEVASPARELGPFEFDASFVVRNTGPLESLEPYYGYTLRVQDGRYDLGLRKIFAVRALVTTEEDTGEGSLRDLIEKAEEIPHPREVHFHPSVRWVRLESPLVFDSSRRLTVEGHSAVTHHPEVPATGVPWPGVWILGRGDHRLWVVRGQLYLSKVGMQRGRSAGEGGCIFNEGVLHLLPGVWLSDCSAEKGGAIANAMGALLEIEGGVLRRSDAAEGGAIHVERDGSARIADSRFLWNQARSGGAVMNGGSLSLKTTRFLHNLGELGGAVHNSGSLVLSRSEFAQNYGERAGALLNLGSLRDTGSSFTWNVAQEACGAILDLGGSTLERTFFEGNGAREGGALCAGIGTDLVLEGAGFAGNLAAAGGAILLEGARMDLRGSRFLFNMGEEIGGAIASLASELSIETTRFAGNEAARGGAIFALGGPTLVSNSAFLENLAEEGGAIHAGRLRMGNVTLAFNRASEAGGALYLPEGITDLRFTTVAWNEAPRGGGLFAIGQSFLLGANIIAGNVDDDLHIEGESEFFSDGFNLYGSVPAVMEPFLDRNDSAGSPHMPLDPQFGSWVNATLPFLVPVPESPAVDAVPSFYCEKLIDGLPTDQRGVRRPRGGACDIGAVEMY